ncbi:cytochrome c maturation protein CcmE [Roseibium polysiphoniae]|uniref:Cytochrome c-type biogenesis protein CcmE n=1 Tax=Roseibium polysiphoniae TaxID=2571221 RepID=A0A944C9Z4_9HYPH|nr:cytochrome c maturation protein CcmE [Roseibium polysiphoniae]MBD8874879.1 cytochrome c maturation protein CcmE [Roseibium polysiphoniae]MBS8258767.1 cytochrome c maturation protein CcmE [Roseibium polysiphoniae]
MTRKQRRLTMIGIAGAVLAVAVGLILFALNDQIVFFQSPTDIAEKAIPPGQRIRLGGLVEEGTVVRSDDANVSFKVTDTVNSVSVTYKGILPDLFREGQGVVTEGVIDARGVFVADNVLAKHDENYVPKEVAEALKQQGVWQGE